MEALDGLQKVYSVTWNTVLCQERSVVPSMLNFTVPFNLLFHIFNGPKSVSLTLIKGI